MSIFDHPEVLSAVDGFYIALQKAASKEALLEFEGLPTSKRPKGKFNAEEMYDADALAKKGETVFNIAMKFQKKGRERDDAFALAKWANARHTK